MFGWEFPPHISGGLGTACYGITEGLSALPDMEVIFIVPKLWGDERQARITLLGANQIPVMQSHIQFSDTSSKIEYYELHSGLIPYLGTSEYEELRAKLTASNHQLVELTSDNRFIFAGDYGSKSIQETQNYAVVPATLARELSFDVIHVHDWMTFDAGIAAKRISGKPLVVQVHSTEFDRSGKFVNPGICAIEKAGMEEADKVIAVSNLTKQILVSNYHLESAKVHTVYNAVKPLQKELKRCSKRKDGKSLVTFLGRITMQKGPEYFEGAANLVIQKNRNVHFIMAGKGDLRSSMIQRTIDLGISEYFDFPGFIPDDEVNVLFSKSDVFVMPSVSEPFGIVAHEAMQALVPVIASKQSGASEMLENVIKVDYWDI